MDSNNNLFYYTVWQNMQMALMRRAEGDHMDKQYMLKETTWISNTCWRRPTGWIINAEGDHLDEQYIVKETTWINNQYIGSWKKNKIMSKSCWEFCYERENVTTSNRASIVHNLKMIENGYE